MAAEVPGTLVLSLIWKEPGIRGEGSADLNEYEAGDEEEKSDGHALGELLASRRLVALGFDRAHSFVHFQSGLGGGRTKIIKKNKRITKTTNTLIKNLF